MEWLVTLTGAAMVLIILRDLFHTLWHPTRHGGLSRIVMTGLWRLLSPGRAVRGAAGLVGPLGMVGVVVMWAGGVAVGWALVYWPHLPEGFAFSSALDPAAHSGPVDALYISLVIVATLGLGDIAPAEGWLRVVAPLEALVGFALLTATVSWVLGIYPALARRRALALRLRHLRRAGLTPQRLDSDSGAAVLDGLAGEIARVCVDFTQYPESYYFHDGPGDASLARAIGYAAELAEQAQGAQHAGMRLAGSVLGVALDDLAAVLDDRFLHTGADRRQILTAYAHDHGGH
ncbi:two pore domain potassium channel family protein [Streptomyces sp. D2-8]|uniref:potassium channel family protein n=1 Tax=Streptomyces sp. D2-8 TaxID=2707767 RepID=UPI0020BEA48F|nr:potassium channel family protein [Streptomyces sp. D2-8]MCK8434080.1 two pore domain potassium channel family protein [Streptomyces sp. D2-8]